MFYLILFLCYRSIFRNLKNYRKRLLARSDSDSSSSSSGGAIQANGDARFECHRLRRMKKARAQLRPVNSKFHSFLCFPSTYFLSYRFLKASISVSDINPMHTDHRIDFSRISDWIVTYNF